MVSDRWWKQIMGIGASTNVKEIHIDQNDAKWESYPSSASSRRSSKSRSLANFGKRWINSAESSANSRRFQQLNAALESADKRAQDAEQRVRQLERELATLELRNMELADETTWLRKQLSDRPEVPLLERPPTATLKNLVTGATSSSGDIADAYRNKQAQYVSKLESQIKLYEEDILKLKTKLSKETQRLQAELEDQKHRSDKEVRSLDNKLIEAHKLNQKYEEVISSKLSPDTIAQLRNEVLADCGTSNAASSIRAAASASSSTAFADVTGNSLSQSKSRAQLILELTEQISVQQDKIRYMEDEIAQRDIQLSHLRTLIQKTEQGTNVGSSNAQKSSRSSAPTSNRSGTHTTAGPDRSSSTTSSGRTIKAESTNAVCVAAAATVTKTVANEDEIEALLNNPTTFYEPEGSDDDTLRQEDDEDDQENRTAPDLSVSQNLQQQQLMSASLRSVPASWRKEPAMNSAAALPPSGASQKRIINIVNTIDGNNLGGKIGPPPQITRPKTMAGGRQKISASPKRQQTVDERGNEETAQHKIRSNQASNENSGQSIFGSRTHSAPMFSFKPRPTSKETKRSALSTGTSRMEHELPPAIDLEEPELDQVDRNQPSASYVDLKKSRTPYRKNSDSIEVLSLHDHDTAYGNLANVSSESVLGYDSSNAIYDDEGDIEDEDDDQNVDYNSDQEIRRKFEERWKKSTVDEPAPTVTRSSGSRPPAGGGVGQAARTTAQATSSSADHRRLDRTTTSAKSQDSGFLGDSCGSTNSLSLWKGRNKRQKSLQQASYDPLDVDKLLEM